MVQALLLYVAAASMLLIAPSRPRSMSLRGPSFTAFAGPALYEVRNMAQFLPPPSPRPSNSLHPTFAEPEQEEAHPQHHPRHRSQVASAVSIFLASGSGSSITAPLITIVCLAATSMLSPLAVSRSSSSVAPSREITGLALIVLGIAVPVVASNSFK